MHIWSREKRNYWWSLYSNCVF